MKRHRCRHCKRCRSTKFLRYLPHMKAWYCDEIKGCIKSKLSLLDGQKTKPKTHAQEVRDRSTRFERLTVPAVVIYCCGRPTPYKGHLSLRSAGAPVTELAYECPKCFQRYAVTDDWYAGKALSENMKASIEKTSGPHERCPVQDCLGCSSEAEDSVNLASKHRVRCHLQLLRHSDLGLQGRPALRWEGMLALPLEG